MMRASRVSLALGSLLLACAPPGDGSDETAERAPPEVVAPVQQPPAVPGTDGGGVGAQQAPPDVAPSPVAAEPPPSPTSSSAEPAARCLPAPGTTGSPQSIAELMELLDGLPKPTSVACLLESLDRPLELYLTSSTFSAQPAPTERSPRTFVVLGPLLLSVVAEGDASTLVEVGYQTAPARSIKAEIPFPLHAAPTPAQLLDQVRIGRVTMCGGCHTNERQVPDPFFDGDGAFESDVIPPLFVLEVGVEQLRSEAEGCDAEQEPGRCGLLSALFDHGEVRQSTLWSEQP